MKNTWRKLVYTTAVPALTWIFANINPLPAQAIGLTLKATVTADNHYGLYIGNQDGSQLEFIGRNEKGFFDIPDPEPPFPNVDCPLEQGPFNWGCPEAFSVGNISPSVIYSNDSKFFVDIYTIVWDDDAVASALLGQFNLNGCDCEGNELFSTSFLTDSSWQYFFSDIPNPGSFGDVPPLETVSAEIAFADTNNQWLPVITLGPNDGSIFPTFPWMQIPGINPSAQFLDASTFGDQNIYFFRKTVEVVELPVCVPEPSMILGLGTVAGLGFFSFSRKRLQKK